jgi:hypothetical protein
MLDVRENESDPTEFLRIQQSWLNPKAKKNATGEKKIRVS